MQKIATAGENLKSAGDKVSSTGEKLLPASAAVTALGVAAVKTDSDFDSSMSQVAAVSGATGDDFDKLRAKAHEMGAKTKFSASEAADAMNYMAMAGWKTSDMLDGIEGIMNLAAASGEDLATTSDIVTDALTAFGLTAKDSGHFADILAAASSNANTKAMDDWRLRSRKHRHDYHQVHQPICPKHSGLSEIHQRTQGHKYSSHIREGIHSSHHTKKLTMWLTQLYSCSSIYATILIIQSFIFIHSFFCFSNQG